MALLALAALVGGCAGGSETRDGVVALELSPFDEVGVTPQALHMKLGDTAVAILAEQVIATEGLSLVLPAERLEKLRTRWELLSETPQRELDITPGSGDVTIRGKVSVDKGDLVIEAVVVQDDREFVVPVRGPLTTPDRNKLLFRETALKIIARLKPEDAEIQVRLGITLREEGLIKDAIEAYKQAIAIRPAYAAAHYNMGVAFDAAGDTTSAVACYRRAVEADSMHSFARYNLALDLLRQREEGESQETFGARVLLAEEHLRFLVKSTPRLREGHMLLVDALIIQKRFDEAVDAARAMERIFPGDGRIFEMLGSIYMNMEDHDKAIAAFEKAQELEPGLVTNAFFLARALEASGKKQEAIVRYREFVVRAGSDPKFRAARDEALKRIESLGGNGKTHREGSGD